MEQSEHHFLAVPIVPLDTAARFRGGSHFGVFHPLLLQNCGRVLISTTRGLRAIRCESEQAETIAQCAEQEHSVRAAGHLPPRSKGPKPKALQVAPHHRQRLHLSFNDAHAESHSRVVWVSLGALLQYLLLRSRKPNHHPRVPQPRLGLGPVPSAAHRQRSTVVDHPKRGLVAHVRGELKRFLHVEPHHLFVRVDILAIPPLA
mmetsp:Transcript_4215/g.7723  ORF Transcript_4215/g.7723 Transcript_4215/m.7723 type:complete len:203 (+) Transcript_4215:73-681(+)